MEELNLLAEQQDEMVKQGNLRAAKGLCMREAALLRERAKELDGEARTVFLEGATEAMARALAFDDLLH